MYGDLDGIEKEVELIRTRGMAGVGNEDFEECRRHIELIVELCIDIRETCHEDGRKIFIKVAE